MRPICLSYVKIFCKFLEAYQRLYLEHLTMLAECMQSWETSAMQQSSKSVLFSANIHVHVAGILIILFHSSSHAVYQRLNSIFTIVYNYQGNPVCTKNLPMIYLSDSMSRTFQLGTKAAIGEDCRAEHMALPRTRSVSAGVGKLQRGQRSRGEVIISC